MKVLIAEADAVSLSLLQAVMRRRGHEAEVVSDGLQAWKRVQEGDYQLVIADWRCAEQNGFSLGRTIRARPDLQSLYLLLLTAGADCAPALSGRESGADDCLRTPLDPWELDVGLDRAMRILSLQAELTRRSEQLQHLEEDRSQQEERLQNAIHILESVRIRFSELFMGLPIACFTYDREGVIQEWNRACERLYGMSGGQLVQRPIWDTICRGQSPGQMQEIVEQVCAGRTLEGLEWTERLPDGRVLNVLCNTFPLHVGDGVILGGICANVDITRQKALEMERADQLRHAQEINAALEAKQCEIEQMNRRLVEANASLATINALLGEKAVTDGLTELKNYAFFMEALEASCAFARRRRLAVSVILLDIDQFKPYNDTYGHPAGDEALVAIAQILRENVRMSDVPARYGGEEFALLLPGTDAQGALEVAERVRRATQTYSWPYRRITASFGVATLGPGTETPRALVEQADRALYWSKAGGRDCVTHFQTVDAEADSSRPAQVLL